jgi:Arc/MetJ-type ribon-helix-helix transcriptional regulator
MKISVSLAEEDIEFLDEYAKNLGVPSRSAVIQRAVRLLRAAQLGPAYAEAWSEWEAEGEADAWDAAVGDGIRGGRSSGSTSRPAHELAHVGAR